MFYSARYFIWALVIAVLAVVLYERYDEEILRFGRALASALGTLILR
jgi:hypothetical protein